MSFKQTELVNKFSDHNPEVGSFEEGAADFEQVSSLSHILSSKIRSLSREKVLTDREVSYIQKTGDLTARSIIHMVEQMGMTLPKDIDTRVHLGALIMATGQIEDSWNHLPTSSEVVQAPLKIVDLLTTVPAGTVSLRHNPHLRAPFEDYAVASLDLMSDMADHIGGFKIDHYLEGNIQNMIAHYEQLVNE